MRTIGLAMVAALAACGSKSTKSEAQAVGTYIGAGSILTGANKCVYDGEAGVFGLLAEETAGPKEGIRFIVAPGKITEKCGDSQETIIAVNPTGAVITGPAKIKKGGKNDSFDAALTASNAPINGKADIEWTLGQDCEGRATFETVMGSQDTGGKDRHRSLVATATGPCTLIAKLTTGSSLYEAFAPKAFQAEKVVTIE